MYQTIRWTTGSEACLEALLVGFSHLEDGTKLLIEERRDKIRELCRGAGLVVEVDLDTTSSGKRAISGTSPFCIALTGRAICSTPVGVLRTSFDLLTLAV